MNCKHIKLMSHENEEEIHDHDHEDLNSENLLEKARQNIKIIYVNSFTEESYKSFRSSFLAAEKSKQTIIPIIIDSYGGETHSLFAMIDLINSTKLKVATIATGKAMSSGAALLSAGTKGLRFASPHTSIMIHEGSSATYGKSSDVQADAKELERINEQYLQLLDKNCDKQLGYWKSHLKENRNSDLYLTPQMCKEHGLIDVIAIPRIEPKLKITTTLVY